MPPSESSALILPEKAELSVSLLLPEKINLERKYEIRRKQGKESNRIHRIAFLVREIVKEASDAIGVHARMEDHMPDPGQKPFEAANLFPALMKQRQFVAESDVTVVIDPSEKQMHRVIEVSRNHLHRMLAVFSHSDAWIDRATEMAKRRIPLAEDCPDPTMIKLLPTVFAMHVPEKIADAKPFHDQNIALVKRVLLYPKGPALETDRHTWLAS